MFWYVMLTLFSPLYLMFALLFRDDRARLVLALYQPVLILQRQLGKRPSLAKGEQLALVLSALLVAKQRFTDALLIVRDSRHGLSSRGLARRLAALCFASRPAARGTRTPPETISPSRCTDSGLMPAPCAISPPARAAPNGMFRAVLAAIDLFSWFHWRLRGTLCIMPGRYRSPPAGIKHVNANPMQVPSRPCQERTTD
jgi:hypothetical protein